MSLQSASRTCTRFSWKINFPTSEEVRCGPCRSELGLCDRVLADGTASLRKTGVKASEMEPP